MIQSYRILVWAVVIGVTVVLNGCGSPASQEKPKATTPSGQGEHAGHAGHEGHKHDANHGEQAMSDNHADAASADATKGLAELSDEDRAAAEKQRVCPVSGEALGTMGKPYKVALKGRTVFLCCSGCEEDLTKNPDKYLAKIDADKPK
jgi:YHS domain-containing protein